MERKRRDYQQGAIDATILKWNEGVLNLLIALPTGTGKSYTCIELLKDVVKRDERVLWLAHRLELILQPLKWFNEEWPEIDIGIVKARDNDVHSQMMLGSIQTLSRPERLAQLLEAGPIDYVVYDEAHHAPTVTGKRVLDALREANPNLKHVGLTATPWRADGVGMITCYDEISYQMNIRKAIRQGWLVPVDGLHVQTDVNIAGVKVYHGDFAAGQLDEVLNAAGWDVLVARAYLKHCVEPYGEEKDELLPGEPSMQAIAYTAGVAGSKLLCEALKARGVNAAHVDANTPREERKEILGAFRNRKIQVVCNVGILTEGFDAPSTEAILMARPTRSHGLHTQIIGRGLRIYPGKERCLVLLFKTTGARILTLADLGESKEVKAARTAAEKTGIEGFSEPMALFDEDEIDGAGLYARVVNLFGDSTSAWFRDGAIFSLGLGEHEGFERTLVILPPNGSDDWSLIGLGRKITNTGTNAWGKSKKKRGYWKIRELSNSGDIEDLMDEAMGIIDRRGIPVLSERSKRWRSEPISIAQLKFAVKWVHNRSLLDDLNKGEAAQIITHGIACDTLREAGYLT